MSILEVNGFVPESFQFTKPPLNLVTTGNAESQLRFRSSIGGQISPQSTQSISINMNSASEYMDMSQSYLEVSVSVRDATGAIKTGGVISSAGLGALFSQVSLRLGETVIEDLKNYPLHLMNIYQKEPASRKAFLKVTEGYTNPAILSATGKMTFCHGIQAGFLKSGSKLPLAHCANGLTLDLTLADPKTFFVGDGSLTYLIESIVFVGKMVAPSPDYLARQFASLAAGRSLVIPYVRTRTFVSAGSNSQVCNVVSQLGQIQSLAGYTSYYHRESDLADTTKDKVILSANPGIRLFSVTACGQTWPTGKPFTVVQDASDPSSFFLQEILQNGVYDACSGGIGDYSVTAQAFQTGYCWRSSGESFGSGLNLINSNGQLEQLLDGSVPIPSSIRITTFAWVDTLLVLSGGQFAEVAIYDRFGGI